jgi:signal transduction histidine kinase
VQRHVEGVVEGEVLRVGEIEAALDALLEQGAGQRLVLREAITNVVDNAIKYSPQASTIDVGVRMDGRRAVLSVADEGAGIAPEHRDRIFDRFFRLDEGRSRDEGGAGLGLAIAKWAVEANGGDITVQAGTQRGALFRITLPIETERSTVEAERDKR